MLKGTAPTGKNCDTPIETLLQAGRKNGINGTPTLIFADGSVIPGMIPADTIEKKLNAAWHKIASRRHAQYVHIQQQLFCAPGVCGNSPGDT